MEAKGQLHIPAAFPRRKILMYPLCLQSRSEGFEEKGLLLLPGIKLWFRGYPSLRLVTILTTLCAFTNLRITYGPNKYDGEKWILRVVINIRPIGIVPALPLRLRENRVSVPDRDRDLPFLHSFSTSPVVHPASYPIHPGGCFQGGKVAPVWIWALTTI